MNISIGETFGRLKIISEVGRNRHYRPIVLCLCDCGANKIVDAQGLRSGKTRSCGCLQKELLAKRAKHGALAGGKVRPEYSVWRNMIQRCTNQKNKHFNYYGGRGITVSDRWRNSFAQFLSDMGPKPTKNHTLDRINNNIGYGPGNCRWATRLQQANNLRTNRILTHAGKSMSVSAWARELGINRSRLEVRVHKGMSDEEAFSNL